MKSLKARTGASSMELAIILVLILSAALCGYQLFLHPIMDSCNSIGSELSGLESNVKTEEIEAVLASRERETKEATTENIIFIELYYGILIAIGVIVFRLYLKKRRDRKAAKIIEQKKFVIPHNLALENILRKRNSLKHVIDVHLAELLTGHSTVGQFMTEDVATVRPNDSIETAMAIIKEKGFRRVLVTEADGELKGVISKKDIATKNGKHVFELMTSEPKSVPRNTCLGISLSILLENRLSCLPVVEDGKLVGLISATDMLVILQCVLVVLYGHREEIRLPGNGVRQISELSEVALDG